MQVRPEKQYYNRQIYNFVAAALYPIIESYRDAYQCNEQPDFSGSHLYVSVAGYTLLDMEVNRYFSVTKSVSQKTN